MQRKVYLTMLGRSTWALLNSYYAVVREKGFHPDTVFIFTEDSYQQGLEKAKAGIQIISDSYGFNPTITTEIVKEDSFVEAGKKASSLIKNLKTEGAEVAVDTTAGRKALVASILFTISSIDISHLFYLMITSVEGNSKPYMMIPLQIQRLRDFVQEAREM